MSKDDRSTISFLDIEILPGGLAPLEVGVSCLPETSCLPPSADGILINLDAGRFLAKGICTRSCDAFTVLSYSWTVTIDKGNDDLEVLQANDAVKFPYGTQNEDLLLAPEFFKYLYVASPILWKFRLRLTLTDTATNNYGFSEFYLAVNRPPSPGTCSCQASYFPFICIRTVLTCTCTGWTDPEAIGIRSYQFIARRTDITDRLVQVILDPTARPETQFLPSPGSYNFTCTIIDSSGGLITVPVPVVYSTTNPTTGAKTTQTASVFDIVAPTAAELQDMEKEGLLDSLVSSNPSLSDMVLSVKLSMLQSSITLTEISGTSASSTGSSELTSAIDSMSSTLATAGESLLTVNMASPQQMTSAAMQVSGLFSAVPAGSPAVAAISPSLLLAASAIFENIGNSLESGTATFSKQTLTSFLTAAMTTMDVTAGVSSSVGGCDQNPPNPDLSQCPKSQIGSVQIDEAFPPPINTVVSPNRTIQECCAVLSQKNQGLGSAATSMQRTTGLITAALTNTIAVGEKVNLSPVPGTTIQVMKESPANLPGKPVEIQGSSFKMPESMDLGALTGGRPVGLAAVVMDKNPLVGENTASDKMSPGSGVVSFDLSDETGKPIKIENVEPGIEIMSPLPRSAEKQQQLDVEALRCVNATTAGVSNKTERVLYSTILPSPSSDFSFVEIRMEDFSEPPPGLHYIIGRTMKPSLIKGYFEPGNVARIADLQRMDEFYVNVLTWPNGTGPIHVGLFELKDGLVLEEVIKQSNWDNLPSFFKANFSKNYCVRVTDGGVNYFNGTGWNNRGIKVKAITPTGIVFTTSHLSTFGSGFFVQPNAIDFSSVFAKAGFDDNLTIYLTLIFTFIIYIVLLVWARINDRRDVQQLGALPLSDNKPGQKYFYEMLVVTGDQNSAATNSSVSFIISGDGDETDIRTFGRPDKGPRKFFRRGATDAFVLAVDRPLGDLQFIRIWHDCSGIGTFCSWFCNSISIRDVQTGKRFDFIVNNWLSPTDRDGEVDRLISIAGDEDRKQFGYLFDTQKTRNLRDNHLWFSVFTRPPRSRYTRVQRVSTCMALLYLSMLANAMWYGTVPDQPGSGGVKFGPFSISQEQIGVGMMSNLVVLPPSLLIVFLFRKARPRKLRKSRIDQALQNQGGVSGKAGNGEETIYLAVVVQHCGLDSLPGLYCCLDFLHLGIWNYIRERKMHQMGHSTDDWVLLVNPLRSAFEGNVMVLAMIFSAICKTEPDDDDADEDEEDPTVHWDETLLSDTGPLKKKTLGGPAAGIDAARLAATREKRQKEQQVWAAMKDILFYSLYIWILIAISYNNRDPNAGLLKINFENTFINPIRLNASDRFSKVQNMGAFWKWVEEVLVSSMRAPVWYNGDRPFGLQGFLSDYSNRMLGFGIMRQIRIKPDSCTVPVMMRKSNFTGCSNLMNLIHEDKLSYCTEWRKASPAVSESDCDWSEFKYSKGSKYKSLPHIGRIDTYSGGGYTFVFQGRESEIRSRLIKLRDNQWLNSRTRAVIIEFATYNAQVNLFTVAKIIIEAIPGGGLFPDWRFDGIRLMRHFEGFGMVALVCEVAFAVFTLYFTVVAFKAMCKNRKAFFSSYWSYLELAQLAMSYTAIVLYIVRHLQTNEILEQFSETLGNAYIPMQHVASVDELFGYFIAFLLFAAMISLLKLLKFNKSIGMLSATMRHCFDDLMGFGTVFLIFLAAFVILFHLFLSQHIYEWHTIVSSFETAFSIMLGKFEFGQILETNLFAGIAFFFFNVAMSIIMINLLMTIIINSFETAKQMAENTAKDHEVVDFMIERMKVFMGMANAPGGSVGPTTDSSRVRGTLLEPQNPEDMKEFPQKVDQMLDRINNVYFDGALDLNNKAWLKGMLKKDRTDS
ncbi:unnamed protein product [Notodromas monacha]|uniref:PLAT domain-containing protein n=1 Tax=Notodromas monacha TaxID=399045 RepID=A0A7R9G816_9CRUS|nr:unnamed protein product [Notodromas monacha]CAG0912636.1 unnamed protein product [Notodromas monacha]